MSCQVPRQFFGWRVMWAALIVAVFGWGIGFYGPPIFLYTLASTRGWSIGLISAAVTTHYLVGALLVANLPSVYRTVGLTTTTNLGALCLTLGMFGWTVAEAPWQLFAATLVSGAGWAAMGAVAINTMISRWFDQGRPKALSMAYNGASIGGVVLTPIWVTLIAYGGLSMAAAIVGAVTIIVVCSLSNRYFRQSPASLGTTIDGHLSTLKDVPKTPSKHPERPRWGLWKSQTFISYVAGFTIGLFVQVGIIAHLYSLIVADLGVLGAGLAAGFATACAIAGRTLVGCLLSPAADRRLLAATTYIVQAAGCLVLVVAMGESIPLLFLGILLFGVGVGNVTSLPPLIAQIEFVPIDVPRAVALATAIAQACYAFAPATFGLLRELPECVTGLSNVTVFFVTAAALQIMAATIYRIGR